MCIITGKGYWQRLQKTIVFVQLKKTGINFNAANAYEISVVELFIGDVFAWNKT
ncbi:hypothetical protein [Mucilaginibacter aquaedulcis]|uniref:hypothetical protein n=1 Tax=Mucilaginibacter aquaedulcis TaxID=1187081 RepID=UPI0025B3D902|nr:hypothetical protein [Mucilaginibacter aquaedulcis]MDN3550025.1 hypothetical protein [Mucilaginibacter aquaedulcis]